MTLEPYGCKLLVSNLSIVPHTSGILTANVTLYSCFIINKSQVNTHVESTVKPYQEYAEHKIQ